MDAIGRNRILLALALIAVIAVAVALDRRAVAGPQAQLEQLREHKMDLSAAKAKAKQRDLVMNRDDRRFQERLDEDAKRFGVQPTSPEALGQANAYTHIVRDNVVLAPGKTFASDWLEVRAAIEPIRFIKQGAEIRAKHSLVYVKNVHDKALAYFLDVREADAAGCDVRGARAHNAVALLPGEVAEVVVCAGKRAVEIHDLQALELSPLGYMYVSQVPARAFGHDEIRGQAHRIPRQARRCSQVPSERLYSALREQRIAWRDVADFFARHNCDAYPWLWPYRYAQAGVSELPVRTDDLEAVAPAP